MWKLKHSWQDYATFFVKNAFAVLFVFVGLDFVDKYHWDWLVQIVFWPIYGVFCYWIVVREIHFKKKPLVRAPTGSVIIRFPLQLDNFGSASEIDVIHKFTDELAISITEVGLGEFDGDEFGGGECVFFMYATDPDKLFEHIENLLHSATFLQGGTAELKLPNAKLPYRTVNL